MKKIELFVKYLSDRKTHLSVMIEKFNAGCEIHLPLIITF